LTTANFENSYSETNQNTLACPYGMSFNDTGFCLPTCLNTRENKNVTTECACPFG